MRYLHFLLLAGITFLVGCEKDHNHGEEYAPLDINFQLVYGDQPLIITQDYIYPTGELFSFTGISHFISNITLYSGEEKLLLEDVRLIDLAAAHTSAEAASNGLTLHFHEVNKENYGRLEFSIGVPEALNAKKPSDFPSAHPLATNSFHWAPWNSYIFSKFEGNIDLIGDGSKETGFSLHTGDDKAFRTVSLPISLDLRNAESGEIHLIVDMKKLFEGEQIYNIRDFPQAHTQTGLNLIMEVAGNYARAFSVKN
jgi:hypothetical protein